MSSRSGERTKIPVGARQGLSESLRARGRILGLEFSCRAAHVF